MAIRFYLVPKIGAGTRFDMWRPKYVDPDSVEPGWLVTSWRGMDYGAEASYLLVLDVTPEQHTALSGLSDVVAIPPLDNTVTAGTLATVQAQLEAMNIPGNWVAVGMTYRFVLRTAIKVFEFLQRYQAMFPGVRVFGAGVTLSTQLSALTAAQRQRLSDVADSFGVDRSDVTLAMTIRQVLKLLGDRLPNVTLSGEAF